MKAAFIAVIVLHPNERRNRIARSSLPLHAYHPANRVQFQRPGAAGLELLEVTQVARAVIDFALLAIEGDRVIGAIISQALVAAQAGLLVVWVEIVPIQRVGLDGSPFVQGVIAVLLCLRVTVLHLLGVTVAPVDGLLLTDLPAVIVAGNVVSA